MNDFDAWYEELIAYLTTKGKRAPYKMAWIDLYNDGFTVEDAVKVNTAFIEDI